MATANNIAMSGAKSVLIATHTCAPVDEVIAPNGDLIIEVIEEKPNWMEDNFVSARATTRVRVQRSTLISAKNHTSRTFSNFYTMLAGPFAEAFQDIITIHDECVPAILVLFRVLHGLKDTPAQYKTTHHRLLFYLVKACDKYNIEYGALKKWVSFWIKHNRFTPAFSRGLPTELIFPLWKFDDASGFSRVTKMLVYDADRPIKIYNPGEDDLLQLPRRITQQLDAVRGRLRTIPRMRLTALMFHISSSGCDCSAQTLLSLVEALKTYVRKSAIATDRAWSANECIGNLKNFKMPSSSGDCKPCAQIIERKARAVAKELEKYFDGLCLDCLDPSNPRRKDLADSTPGKYCRIKYHSEPTAYFSELGKRDWKREDIVRWEDNKEVDEE